MEVLYICMVCKGQFTVDEIEGKLIHSHEVHYYCKKCWEEHEE